jgi:hypothetical protein
MPASRFSSVCPKAYRGTVSRARAQAKFVRLWREFDSGRGKSSAIGRSHCQIRDNPVTVAAIRGVFQRD